MTGLLVSVRNAEEAQAALDAAVDIVDVKEPSRGSLGRADFEAIADIRNRVAGRVPLSVALGELLDPDPWPHDFSFDGIRFAKLGLAGCARIADWPTQWRTELERLPSHVVRVAVAYADWQTSATPAVEEILEHASRLQCQVLLIDTYDKQHGNLLAYFSLEELQQIVARCRRANLLAVLAGSLAGESLSRVQTVEPDLIAVRGAVCAGDRVAHIDPEKVHAVRAMLQGRSVGNQS